MIRASLSRAFLMLARIIPLNSNFPKHRASASFHMPFEGANPDHTPRFHVTMTETRISFWEVAGD
jgi:hypothetical protein